jgi:hypothetical protein
MIAVHHFWIGILMLISAFYGVFHGWSIYLIWVVVIFGGWLIIDEICQHVKQQSDPEYRSPVNRLYTKTLWKIPLIRAINIWFDKLFGG